MRIGIHNIIPTFAYILYAVGCIFLTNFLFNDLDAQVETAGTVILYIALILACYAMFGLLSFHLKFVFITENKVTVVRPFRFQFETIDLGDIKKIDWNTFSIQRLGDYRKLTLTTDDFKMNFSDFEYINFNSLERFLLDKASLSGKFNLTSKQDVELSQAKGNRWWNLTAILISMFFLAMISWNGKSGTVKLIAQIGIAMLIIRLSKVFLEYQKRIRIFSKKSTTKRKPTAIKR